MTRQQRSAFRKKRRRYFVFSLSACIILFLTGVYITNNVMLETLGMPKEESIFSFGNAGQALGDIGQNISQNIRSIPVEQFLSSAYDLGAELFERLKNLVGNILG